MSLSFAARHFHLFERGKVEADSARTCVMQDVAINHHVVRPLDAHSPRSRRIDQRGHGAPDGHADNEAQRGQNGGRHLRTQQQRAVQAPFGARPHTPLPTVAAALTKRAHHEPFGLARIDGTFDLVVRGRDFVEENAAKRKGRRRKPLSRSTGSAIRRLPRPVPDAVQGGHTPPAELAHSRTLFPTRTAASVTGASFAST